MFFQNLIKFYERKGLRVLFNLISLDVQSFQLYLHEVNQ